MIAGRSGVPERELDTGTTTIELIGDTADEFIGGQDHRRPVLARLTRAPRAEADQPRDRPASAQSIPSPVAFPQSRASSRAAVSPASACSASRSAWKIACRSAWAARSVSSAEIETPRSRAWAARRSRVPTVTRIVVVGVDIKVDYPGYIRRRESRPGSLCKDRSHGEKRRRLALVLPASRPAARPARRPRGRRLHRRRRLHRAVDRLLPQGRRPGACGSPCWRPGSPGSAPPGATAAGCRPAAR